MIYDISEQHWQDVHSLLEDTLLEMQYTYLSCCNLETPTQLLLFLFNFVRHTNTEKGFMRKWNKNDHFLYSLLFIPNWVK